MGDKTVKGYFLCEGVRIQKNGRFFTPIILRIAQTKMKIKRLEKNLEL